MAARRRRATVAPSCSLRHPFSPPVRRQIPARSPNPPCAPPFLPRAPPAHPRGPARPLVALQIALALCRTVAGQPSGCPSMGVFASCFSNLDFKA
ncbi:hypothetical protein ABZP36_028124 [Zizania latifolia]